MKYPAGNAPSRRLASPRQKARLDLRRRSASPEPDDELDTEHKSPFWTWVLLIALFHLFLIGFVAIFYQPQKTTPPKEQFFTLVPPGNMTKGTPGTETAPKVSPATPAPSAALPTPPPPTEVAPVTPPPPAAIEPTPKPVPPPSPVAVEPTPKPVPHPPIVKPDSLTPPPDKPVAIKPPTPKPTPIKPKPKIALSKADLTEVDTPATTTETKPKPAVKKTSKETPDKHLLKTSTSNPDTTGLSRDQVAAKLASELKSAGVENAPETGPSGAANSHASDFSDFYLSVRDQVMDKWQHPNLDDETAVNPEVTIHVEKDGRVPPDQVRLTRSSGNQAYDDSAVAAAKALGNLLQPLPDGCPPDIHIDFKLTR